MRDMNGPISPNFHLSPQRINRSITVGERTVIKDSKLNKGYKSIMEEFIHSHQDKVMLDGSKNPEVLKDPHWWSVSLQSRGRQIQILTWFRVSASPLKRADRETTSCPKRRDCTTHFKTHRPKSLINFMTLQI